jgi:single-stranded-DNA-specific exonuclease
MKYSEWIIPRDGAEAPSRLVAAGYAPLLAALLACRGIDSPELAHAFLDVGSEALPDPLLLRDMDAAAERLCRAVNNCERVAVFGDYDVDGITSACLVTLWLTEHGVTAFPYIPDRMMEGYGLSCAAIDTIAARGVSLIVTVDCGITAAQEASYARSLGIDMVITDHHECGASPLPEAVAVVDPKRPDSAYPNRELAGVGVAFKLLCAAEGGAERLLERYADLVATGTVADVMPLTGENRYLVKRGLAAMSAAPRPGIAVLLSCSGAADRRLTASTVGFTLAPRLNAAGRLGRADVAVQLLMTDDEIQAETLAEELCRLNRERQELEQSIWEDARGMLSAQPPAAPIVLAREGWHQGVIGIAASKLSEEYSLPAVMICLDGDMGKGSCRSCGGFNLFDALSACSDCLEGFGGHALAAGLTIRRERVEDFRAAIAAYYEENPAPHGAALRCDLRIEDPDMLTLEGAEALEQLEPFGSGNARPTLCVTGAELERLTPIGGGKHLRLTLCKGERRFECVLFARTEEELGLREGDAVDAAFYPQVNEFRSRRSLQLLITDLRKSCDGALCGSLLRGECPPPWECAQLCPDRGDFVRVWRMLEQQGGSLGGSLRACDWAPQGMRPARAMMCLRVMEDTGLVELTGENDIFCAHALPGAAKADLDSSQVLKKLRESAAML